jgi:hypothetical protein
MMTLRNAVLLIYISVQRHRVITEDEFFKIFKTWITLADLGYFGLPAHKDFLMILLSNHVTIRRYQRGNQNPHIAEEQTTQWPKSTKGQTTIYKTYI